MKIELSKEWKTEYVDMINDFREFYGQEHLPSGEAVAAEYLMELKLKLENAEFYTVIKNDKPVAFLPLMCRTNENGIITARHFLFDFISLDSFVYGNQLYYEDILKLAGLKEGHFRNDLILHIPSDNLIKGADVFQKLLKNSRLKRIWNSITDDVTWEVTRRFSTIELMRFQHSWSSYCQKILNEQLEYKDDLVTWDWCGYDAAKLEELSSRGELVVSKVFVRGKLEGIGFYRSYEINGEKALYWIFSRRNPEMKEYQIGHLISLIAIKQERPIYFNLGSSETSAKNKVEFWGAQKRKSIYRLENYGEFTGLASHELEDIQ